MATRMQQRRGTASQWSIADPVLAAGEIGVESDTAKFKIGDGVNSWQSLDYYETAAGLTFIQDSEKGANDGVATLDNTGNVPASQLGNAPDPDLSGYSTNTYVDSRIGDATVDGTPGNTVTDRISTAISNLIDNADVNLDTLNELANAINNDDDFATTITNLIDNKQDAETIYLASTGSNSLSLPAGDYKVLGSKSNVALIEGRPVLNLPEVNHYESGISSIQVVADYGNWEDIWYGSAYDASESNDYFVVGSYSSLKYSNKDYTGYATASTSGASYVSFYNNIVANGNTVLAAQARSRVAKSTDGGQSYTVYDPNLGTQSFVPNTMSFALNAYWIGQYNANGLARWSSNGDTWTSTYIGVSTLYGQTTRMVYGNNKLVAGTNNGYIVTGEDKGTITAQNRGSVFGYSSSLSAVAYGNGIFVAASSYGILASSVDGSAWTIRDAGNTAFSDIVFGNGVFLARPISSSSDKEFYMSLDGIRWNAIGSDFVSRPVSNSRKLFYSNSNGDFLALQTSSSHNKKMTPGSLNVSVSISPFEPNVTL